MGDNNGLYKNIADRDNSFKKFLWNSDTKQFLGRTGASWFKIGVFYIIFYACLAGFFAIMMAVFYQTLDTNHLPKYTPGDGGSLLRNPAMGFRPLPRQKNVESTLIWYKNGDNDDIKHWVESLNDFIKPYEGNSDQISGQHVTDCTSGKVPEEGTVCPFQDKWLTDKCKKSESWGYNRESPCILLKLNKMIKWVPDVYETMEELPEGMPKSLKDHIREKMDSNQGKIPKMIWVSCQGENPADQEYIGPIRYSPWQGFPAYFFPYLHTPGYLPPIVAVQFDQPMSNVLINIECRAWAKNIKHDRQNRLGLVHFELLKD
ncbi:sodium/potassium-transporting ATPase subunit beta-like isoform X2 [Homarus americanus]|uniref:sodium/potassium-transporting ATPase subunit beta-like isoform X2 n=1 Tax=Homarus americanus TaxID=6706 RepID=UPI001C47C86A|nr:sodium/potassium-transporting ATPase subunit beta-like isoform X2 [Homarus americanus]